MDAAVDSTVFRRHLLAGAEDPRGFLYSLIELSSPRSAPRYWPVQPLRSLLSTSRSVLFPPASTDPRISEGGRSSPCRFCGGLFVLISFTCAKAKIQDGLRGKQARQSRPWRRFQLRQRLGLLFRCPLAKKELLSD